MFHPDFLVNLNVRVWCFVLYLQPNVWT